VFKKTEFFSLRVISFTFLFSLDISYLLEIYMYMLLRFHSVCLVRMREKNLTIAHHWSAPILLLADEQVSKPFWTRYHQVTVLPLWCQIFQISSILFALYRVTDVSMSGVPGSGVLSAYITGWRMFLLSYRIFLISMSYPLMSSGGDQWVFSLLCQLFLVPVMASCVRLVNSRS